MKSSRLYLLFSILVVLMACTGQPVQNGNGNNDQTGQPVTQALKVYLVAIEGQTGGEGEVIGCGDKLAPVKRTIVTEDDDLAHTVVGALNELFSLSESDVQKMGLYSVFPQMKLRAVGALVENRNITVDIEGQPSLGGECDDPRFKAQIEATIKQFAGIQNVTVRLNGSAEAYQAVGNLKGE